MVQYFYPSLHVAHMPDHMSTSFLGQDSDTHSWSLDSFAGINPKDVSASGPGPTALISKATSNMFGPSQQQLIRMNEKYRYMGHEDSSPHAEEESLLHMKYPKPGADERSHPESEDQDPQTESQADDDSITFSDRFMRAFRRMNDPNWHEPKKVVHTGSSRNAQDLTAHVRQQSSNTSDHDAKWQHNNLVKKSGSKPSQDEPAWKHNYLLKPQNTTSTNQA